MSSLKTTILVTVLLLSVASCGIWTILISSNVSPSMGEGLVPVHQSADTTFGNLLRKEHVHIMGAPGDQSKHVAGACLPIRSTNVETSVWYSNDNLPTTRPLLNVSRIDILGTTSASFSDFYILRIKREYEVCDRLQLLIQARNGRGEAKTFGGDYFRAQIITKTNSVSACSATDGEVVDYADGTYGAFFTLKWTGWMNITVTLVHSSEAVEVIQRVRDVAPAHYVYNGRFMSDETDQHEDTFCNVALSENQKEQCNLSDTRTGSPWFCYKPTSPLLSCRDWKKHRCNKNIIYDTEANNVVSARNRLILSHKKKLPKKSQVFVFARKQSNTSSQKTTGYLKDIKDLPVCVAGTNLRNSPTAGYYFNRVWYLPHCRILHFPKEKMRQCLSGKRFFFFGDSTIRQLFEFYLRHLAPGFRTTSSEPAFHIGPTHAIDPTFNISMRFRHHAFPINRENWYNVKEIHYIANEVDSLVADNNTVLVISLWAHFVQEPEWVYTHRIRTIMAAIRRLQARSPSTIVVVKSANTREHLLTKHIVHASDWLARRLDHIMRKAVSVNQNISFIGAWEMTYAQTIKPNVHPDGSHVENLSNQLLTIACNKS